MAGILLVRYFVCHCEVFVSCLVYLDSFLITIVMIELVECLIELNLSPQMSKIWRKFVTLLVGKQITKSIIKTERFFLS